MAKPSLSMSEVRKVEKLLNEWQEKLGWDSLVKHLKKKHHIGTTRQTLYSYKSIADAFSEAKDRLRGITEPVKNNKNITLKQSELILKIEALKLDNKQLEKQNFLLKGLLNAINCETENSPILKEVLVTVRANYMSARGL